MARFLGIDYGTKRIGIAGSDENGQLAFPKEILPNDKNVFAKLQAIIGEKAIKEIVIGESLDFSGQPNALSADIEIFIVELEKKFGLPIHKEKEFLTTVEARRYSEDSQADASAAALILQRYLDRKNK